MEQQSKGERGVYRRMLGIVGMIIFFIMAVLSGFGFYSPDSNVIWAVGVVSGSLLGIGITKDVLHKRTV